MALPYMATWRVKVLAHHGMLWHDVTKLLWHMCKFMNASYLQQTPNNAGACWRTTLYIMFPKQRWGHIFGFPRW